SRDDGKENESNSISNQKKLLSQKAKDLKLTNTKFYVDDGYTGTNFNRPGFQAMLEDIEMGYVTTVMVKDLSRLGRDYVSVGHYTDNFFPERNIRFIAVNDLVDSADGENEIAPFKNIMNEMYARDISRKVRSAYRIRGNLGEPLSQPPYGYMKDPTNKKRWIVDPEAAEVVRRIFDMCIEGKGNETIARILQEQKVLIPMAYWQSKGLKKGGKKTQSDPFKWCKTTVGKILAQQEYCGDVINFKTYSKNFKNKTRMPSPEENWRVFKNVHEPIIDRETFETVQKMKAKAKRRAPNPEHAEKNMFCGLLCCADCGSPLWFNVNHPNTAIQYFMCSNYKGRRGTCEGTHYIRADSLEQIVMLELRSLSSFLTEDEEAFADILEAKTNKNILNHQKFLESSIDKSVARTQEIALMYEKLFEKHIKGIVTEESFMQLSQKYEAERDELKIKIREYRDELSEIESFRSSKEQFTTAIRKFMQMETLTPALLNELIEKIEVHSIEGKGRNKTQRIVIHYRFVGVLEKPIDNDTERIILEARQGVAVEYLTA
ncbi:MAG: recombinase family protein, partial [Acutalibacteraceae bacterium]